MKNKQETFYKTPKWKSLRESILMRDKYMCQYCKRFGKHVQADHVHHILPREFFPQYSYTPWNLISLCNKCHEAMHYRKDKTLTAEGKELVSIMARKYFLDLDKLIGSSVKEN